MDWTLFDTLTDLARADLRAVSQQRFDLLERWHDVLSEFGLKSTSDNKFAARTVRELKAHAPHNS